MMPPEGLGALLFCLLPPQQPAPDQARQSSLCTQAALFRPGGLRGHEGVAGAQGLEGHGLPQGLAEKGPLCPPRPGGGLWPGGCGGHRTKRGLCGLIQTRESALMALPSHHGHWGEGWQQNHLLQEAPPRFCWARLLMAHLSHRP